MGKHKGKVLLLPWAALIGRVAFFLLLIFFFFFLPVAQVPGGHVGGKEFPPT
jgi:hypothetical protein